MSNEIRARMVIEVMGWPKEQLVEHLEKFIDGLKEDWEIENVDYAEPEKVGDKKMYSAFVEFEAIAPSLRQLMFICLQHAPSVVEILEPDEFILKASDLQDVLADVTGRIQEMDKKVKMLSSNLQNIKKKISQASGKSKVQSKNVKSAKSAKNPKSVSNGVSVGDEEKSEGDSGKSEEDKD